MEWVLVALAGLATVLAVALVTMALLRPSKPQAPASPAQHPNGSTELLTALEQLGVRVRATAMLVIRTSTTGVVAGDVDGDEDARHDAFAAALRIRFDSEAVFRLSSRELAVLLPAGAASARSCESALRDAARAALLDGRVTTGLALGADVVDLGGDYRGLWACAEAAAREATRRGGGTLVAFRTIVESAVPFTRAHIDGVRELLSDGRLAVSYQPIFALAPRRLLGFEALTRPDSQYGLAGPAQAFAAALHLGRAAELDALCLDTVLDDAPGFDMPAGSLLFLSLTPAAIADPSFAPEALARRVRHAGLAPERVVIELSESATAHSRAVDEGLWGLARTGFKIALDNVGSRSVAGDWLPRVPVDYLKLDGALARSAAADTRVRALVQGICVAADGMGAQVIAKGVDDDESLALVHCLPGPVSRPPRIDAALGTHLARPLPRPRLNFDAPKEPSE